MSDENHPPLTFKIEAQPKGWQVETYRGDQGMAVLRTRTLLGARILVWRYRRRVAKAERLAK